MKIAWFTFQLNRLWDRKKFALYRSRSFFSLKFRDWLIIIAVSIEFPQDKLACSITALLMTLELLVSLCCTEVRTYDRTTEISINYSIALQLRIEMQYFYKFTHFAGPKL